MRPAPAAESPQREILPVRQKLCYGMGGAANGFFGNVITVLALPIYSIALGVNPAWIGIALGIPRLWDAISDPLMGNISDNTRCRWGRRKPYILAGGILTPLLFVLLWCPDPDWSETGLLVYFSILSMLYFTALTIWNVPWNALGAELSYDYQERISVQAWSSAIATLAAVSMAWIYKLCFLDWQAWLEPGSLAERCVRFLDTPATSGTEITGIRYAASAVAVIMAVCAIAPAFCREPAAAQRHPPIALRSGLLLTLQCKPFLRLAGAVLSMTVGILLVAPLGTYIGIYYIFAGDKSAAGTLGGILGTLWLGGNLLSIWCINRASKRFGKRQILLAAQWIILGGTVSSWFLFTPRCPWLSAVASFSVNFGVTAVWMLAYSMLGDICDYDELRNHRRREGMFGAVFSWIFKLGIAAVLCLSGILVLLAGIAPEAPVQSEAAVTTLRLMFAGVPGIFLLPAIALMWRYPLSATAVTAIRRRLEKRPRTTAPDRFCTLP